MLERRLCGSALVLVAALTACENGDPSPAAEPREAVNAAAPQGFKSYGAGVPAGNATPLNQILDKPNNFEGKTLIVEGKVQRSCTNKGCWMELAESAKAGSPTCRITFKDYAFFIPTDSAGADARVQGKVELTQVSADYVEHMEGEGAKFPHKNPDGTAKEVRLVATGVQLKK